MVMIGSRAAMTAPALVVPAAPVRVDAPVLPNFNGPRVDPETRTPAWHTTGIQGVGQRFGEWLHEPGTAAMLFRSGAATLRGGLAEGLAAGAGYADQQKQTDAAAGQRAFENQMAILRQAVAQQQADQTGMYQRGSLRNDADRNLITQDNNEGRLRLDANGQRIQLHGIETSAATQRRGQDVQVATNNADNATSRANNAATVAASRYGTDAENYRAGQAAGIGSKNQGYTETQVKTAARPAVNGWFTDTPAVPESVTTTRIPMAPGGNEIRYDAAGNAYRRDPRTGQPVRVR